MVTRENIIEKLENDISIIEYKINNTQEYNDKNKIKRILIKSGIAIDQALPFILASLIMLHMAKINNKTPFITDIIKERGNIEVIDTTNGMHKQNIIYSSFDVSPIEYSTGWKLNEYGLYERRSTTYMINENFNVDNIEEILNMNEDDLNSLFLKLESKMITEENIENLDEKYKEETVVVTRIINTNIYRSVKESHERNIFNTLSFFITSFILGKGLKYVKKITFNNYVQNSLEKFELLYHEINEAEIEKLKEILQIKNENLSLIKGKEYVKRKRK